MTLTITTTAFKNGDPIPEKHARDGDNRSPDLHWSGAPAGTRSFALVVEDPDAPGGTFYHWAVFDIPPDRDGLDEGFGGRTVDGMKFGRNDFGNLRYDGPQPPVGHGVHHYHFRVAALSVPTLNVSGRAGVSTIWKAASKHALASAEVVGTYER